MFHRHLIFSLAAAMTVLMSAPRAQASTIFWGSEFNDLLFDSSEQPLDGGFSFEIGSFQGGFTPTMANLNDWAANWKVFDRAFDDTPADPTDPDSEGWDSANQAFAGTVGHTITGGSDSPDANPLDVFPQGEIVYLWVYNTKNREAGTEWALVTDGTDVGDSANADWVFPDPADDSGSYVWELGDADLAIYGNLNGTLGGGQPFTLQTSLVPVPEPGSLLLAGVAALGMLMRRRRAGLPSPVM